MDTSHFLYHYNITLRNRINPNGKEIRGVKPIIKDTCFEYNFENELDFLDVFDVNKSELYQDGDSVIYTDYIFRGHKDSTWDLLPSIYRKKQEELDKDYKNRINVYASGNGATQYNEVNNFALFVKEIDNLGFSITDCSHKTIQFLDRKSNMNGGNLLKNNDMFSFPKETQLSELALAQHYGVGTRLLDFTKNPFTALFFASENAYPFSRLIKPNDKRIGIWVIPKLLIDAIAQERFLKYVDVKKFQNSYIAAQKGVFLHYFPSTDSYLDLDFKEDITLKLDGLLTANYKNEYINKLINEHIGKPMLFTLPHSNLLPIAKRLKQLNVSWATLMPSLDGVKKEVLRQNEKFYSNDI